MKTIHSTLAGIMFVLILIPAKGQSGLSPYSGLATGSTYESAIGLRAGETSGLTLKKFTGESTALEGIIGTWNYGLSLTLLYEKYVPAFNQEGLKWYFGGGGHMAVKHHRYYTYFDRGRYYYYQYSRLGLGIDGVAGIEYKIPKTPLAVNLEVKPYLEIISQGGIWTSLDPGFGLKLTF